MVFVDVLGRMLLKPFNKYRPHRRDEIFDMTDLWGFWLVFGTSSRVSEDGFENKVPRAASTSSFYICR